MALAISSLAVLALSPICAAGPARPAEDLAKKYPATMTWSGEGLSWECARDDVYKLKSFEFKHGSDLQISCKKATVAIGRHETNALWAVVFPDKPAKIKSKLEGNKDSARTILLRFAPAEINKLFPAKTVSGPGTPWLRGTASRIFRHKVGWKWSTPSGNPTIVQSGWTIVDVDTVEGTRRFYASDRGSGNVTYVSDFEQKVVPSTPVSKQEATEVFDGVWQAFDREYATFVLLPEVDWDQLGKQYKKELAGVTTRLELASIISDMLSHLEDLHVWVMAGDDGVPGYHRERPLNGHFRGSLKMFTSTQEAGKNITWGRTSDGIGYINVHGLNDAGIGDHVDKVLEELADTWGMVIDLRFNGGGGEDLAAKVASRFLDEKRVYSKNQYRNGPKRNQLGPKLDRSFEPRGPWRYEAPVIALWGQRTMSSAESMALMLAQCPQVTTMGDRTAGSSGNPRRLQFDCGITVNMPRWLDMDPQENPVEHKGIEPEIVLDYAPDKFSEHGDPVLDKALGRLREIPQGERVAGREGKGD